MKSKTGKIMIIAGALLILSALLLCLHNVFESRQAGKRAEKALSALKAEIPEIVPATSNGLSFEEENLFEEYAANDITNGVHLISLDGELYCGYLSFPSLELELPVLNSLTYSGLKTAPCRYWGNVSEGDLIIAGHNYSSHFGKLKSLSEGDMIFFTDCSGKKYSYKVISTEEISGSDSPSMFIGSTNDWQLTLFTCTLSGRSRITVRACLVDSLSA